MLSSDNVSFAVVSGPGKLQGTLDSPLTEQVVRADDDEGTLVARPPLPTDPRHALHSLLSAVEPKVGCLVFRNLEVVPTLATTAPYDYFVEERLFTTRPTMSYTNGKAAGRVGLPSIGVPGAHQAADLRIA